jgi:hypothetical protein
MNMFIGFFLLNHLVLNYRCRNKLWKEKPLYNKKQEKDIKEEKKGAFYLTNCQLWIRIAVGCDTVALDQWFATFRKNHYQQTASHLKILNYAAAEASYNEAVICYELYSVGGG